MKSHILIMMCGLLMVSCSRKILIQQASQLSDTELRQSEDRIEVRTYYSGDMGEFITFQVDVDNRSEETLTISERDLELSLDEGNGRYARMRPIRKAELMDRLHAEKEQLIREKKAVTISRVLGSGLGIVAAVLGGVSGPEAIIYGSDSAAGIIDDRRAYNAAQGSIEERIEYHEDYTLSRMDVPAGGHGSFDIHFERVMVETMAILKFECKGNELKFPYEFYLEEIKL